jgi:hypothetical protein
MGLGGVDTNLLGPSGSSNRPALRYCPHCAFDFTDCPIFGWQHEAAGTAPSQSAVLLFSSHHTEAQNGIGPMLVVRPVPKMKQCRMLVVCRLCEM